MFLPTGAWRQYLRLLRSQFSSPQTMVAWQSLRLVEVIRAAGAIPFYRRRFGMVDLHDFPHLPLLKRGEVSDLNGSVRSLFNPTFSFQADRSSGSTGMPAEFLFDSAHQRGRFAARARYLRANGWNPLSRNGWIIYLPQGTPDAGLIGSRLLLNTRFLSVFADLETQGEWLRQLDPITLYTLPSNLEALVTRFPDSSAFLSSLKRVFCGGEVLEGELRRRTRQAWGVEIADNYGSTEAFIAWQCPAGLYHINAEHVLVEIVDSEGNPSPAGQIGKIVITTLENSLMPLIRYEIGDYGAVREGVCRCGRTLPLLDRVVGRAVNLFRTPDGRLVSPWQVIVRLKHRCSLRQFQIIQKTRQDYVLRFVSDDTLSAGAEASLRTDFAEVLGPGLNISFERVAAIERTAGGKYMTALSECA